MPERPQSSTISTREAEVIETFHQSPRNPILQAAHGTTVTKSSVHRILKRVHWKSFIPRSVYPLSEDAHKKKIEFYG
ncbi:hypothetical protein TNCV_2658001 [Trichonephila clavipes]|nr:hypothetical protein TNCV_2658001 [Trichonephila clavipes]